MASSAFKSTSKRTCQVDTSPPSKPTRYATAPPRRRSRSVAPRPHHSDIQFSNRRDNPLFSRYDDHAAETSSTAGRFRSLSRNPTPRSTDEPTETDQEFDPNLARNAVECVDRLETCSAAHPICVPSDNVASVGSKVPNWDDGGSGIYFSEAEEQTINEFAQHILCVDDDQDEASSGVLGIDGAEDMRSICDVPNDLVNQGTDSATASENFTPSTRGPGPVELVLDIRREYVKELELSEERARKLHADLTAEEHRSLELGRVLKELLPYSRVDSLQRCRIARKNSIERRRMSKRLTDEALAYFDECISISTFDSSDLSSLEDPPLNLQVSARDESNKSVARGRSTVGATCSNGPTSSFYQDSRGDDTHDQVNLSVAAVNNSIIQAGAGPSSTFKSKNCNTRGSWSRVQENIRNYSTHKENDKHGCQARTLDRQIDMEDYVALANAESMFFDKVLMKNRIDSGSVAVCEGVTSSASSFIF